MNCEFCKMNRIYGGKDHLVCTNPKNFTFFQNLVVDDGCHHCGRCNNPPDSSWIGFDPSWIPTEIGHVGYSFGDRCHWANGCHRGRQGYTFMDIKPRVDFNGVCKNYKRRKVSRSEPRPRRPVA